MSILINLDRLEQSLTQIKAYVDTQDAALATSLSSGLSTLTDGKVDKIVAGVGEKIVKNIAFTTEALTGADPIGSKLTIATTKLSLEDGSIENVSQDIDLAAVSGVNDLRTIVNTNKGLLDAAADKITALEAAGTAQDEQNDEFQDALDGKQPLDAGLTSLAGLTGVGVVKSTGTDAFEVAKVVDLDIKDGEALAYAVAAFDGKDGSVITDSLVDSTGVEYLATNGATVDLGHANATVVISSIANGDGKTSIYAKDPSEGTNDRLVTESEMITMIDAAITAEADYYGKFSFYAEDVTLAGAKAKIEALDEGLAAAMTAIVFDSAAAKTATAVYDGTNWAWTNLEKNWNNGGWAWIENLLNVASVGGQAPSGRIVYATNIGGLPVMDTMPDRETTPDEFGLTHNGSGALCLKMATLAQYGDTPVSNALNAANLGYGENKTIFEKISDLDYTVATPEEVQAILDSVFGN